MSLKQFSKATWALIVAVGLLLGFYSWIGSIGFWFIGHSPMRAKDYALLYQPLLAFPILLFLMVSLRATVIALWSYVTATMAVYAFVSWPRISPELLSSKADWFLFLAALLLQLSLLIENKRRGLVHRRAGPSAT